MTTDQLDRLTEIVRKGLELRRDIGEIEEALGWLKGGANIEIYCVGRPLTHLGPAAEALRRAVTAHYQSMFDSKKAEFDALQP